MSEQAGQWLRSTGSGQLWLLVEVLQPGLILCKNEVQRRQGLQGVHFKRLAEGEYDYAWQSMCGQWDYAYSDRSVALRLLGENAEIACDHVIPRK